MPPTQRKKLTARLPAVRGRGWAATGKSDIGCTCGRRSRTYRRPEFAEGTISGEARCACLHCSRVWTPAPRQYRLLLEEDQQRLERWPRRLYVVELDHKGSKSVYVGETGFTPEERYGRHKAGIGDAGIVRRRGIGLASELYRHLAECVPWQARLREAMLADELVEMGYRVRGGH